MPNQSKSPASVVRGHLPNTQTFSNAARALTLEIQFNSASPKWCIRQQMATKALRRQGSGVKGQVPSRWPARGGILHRYVRASEQKLYKITARKMVTLVTGGALSAAMPCNFPM